MVNFQKFELNEPLVAIENRQLINPAFYDSRTKSSFDLRQKRNKSLGARSNFLKSAFWNPKTHMILTKRSENPSSNIPTNTLSFAKKYQKSQPKHKVRNQDKKASDMPQPGYYDTAECYDKTFGLKLINAGRMNTDLPRGEGLFMKHLKSERENWKTLDKK